MARPAARKEDLVEHKKAPPGSVLEGSSNVLVNSRPAARMGDKVQHKKGEEPIVQGSGSVLFNGRHAARITDKVACGGEIATGSGNVLIGDGADGRACSVCPGGVTVGSPVNPLLGAKVLAGPQDIDFALPGPLPLVWQRHYSSYVGPAGATPGLLGMGWRLPFEMHLVLGADETTLFDTKNRSIHFGPLGPGELRHAVSEGFWLLRGGQIPAPAASRAHTGSVWQDDPRWQHVPAQWKSDPCYVMAATAERSVWLFAALDKIPDTGTVWALVAMADVLGRSHRYERNLNQRGDLPRGQLLGVEDGLGRRYTLGYTWVGWRKAPADLRLDHVALEGAQTPLVRYRYNPAGDLGEVIDRHGRTVREFQYDHHRISAHRVLGGPWARYVYASEASDAKVIAHSIEDGLHYRFDYERDQTVVTDSLGRRTVYGFSGEGGRQRLSSLTDALGGVTQYHHDLEGQLVQKVDALGRRHTMLRDAQGRVSSTQGPDGRKTQSTWDSVSGQLASITGPDGSTTHFEHDAYGRLLQVTDALGHSTAYRYADPRDEKERPTAEYPRQIVDAKGGIKNLAWTRTGQLARYTDCSGHSTHYRYDAWGELVAVTNALGETLHHERNELGLVSSTTYPDGSRTQYRYDARGQLSCITDALGGQTRYERDRHGRIVQSLACAAPNSPSGQPPQTLAYRYDAVGRLTALVNENGAVTSFAYDVLDRLVQETGFDGRTQRYTYDAAGQLIQSQDCASSADGAPAHTTHYIYDQGGRLVERHVTAAHGHWAATVREEHRFEYDQAGRLVAATTLGAQATQVHLTRDALGRIEEESLRCQDAASDTVFTHSLRHRHDPLGNRISTQQPHAGEIDYLSYGAGHVHQIALNKTALLDIERDALHRETQRRLLVGSQPAQVVTMHRTYDAMGRLARLDADSPHDAERHHAHEPLVGGLSRQYRYDALGQLVGIDRPGLRETRYGYDAAHRLVHASEWQHTPRSEDIPGLRRPSHDSRCIDSQAWFFDPAGNRVEGPHSSRVMNNRIDGDAQQRYRYDPWGNVSHIEHLAGPHRGRVVLLAYDALHQLRMSQTHDPGIATPSGHVTVHYAYDAWGRRIGKHHLRECSGRPLQWMAQTWFGWDGERLVTTQTAGKVNSTVYEPNSFVPLLRVDTVLKTTGRKPEVTTGQYFFHCNHLGTPQSLIEHASGEVIWEIGIDPWGGLQSEPEFLGGDQPIRMQGQQLDVETGFFYNRHRYYNPSQGRYITQDPTGLKWHLNGYSYAAEIPNLSIDPIGLFASQLGFYVHQRAGFLVFGDELSKKELQTIADGHAWADSAKNQTAERAYMHAMRNADSGETAREACIKTNQYLQKVAKNAVSAKAKGNRDTSLFYFSVALHTMQDSVSPSHVGFQPWSDSESLISQAIHASKEIIYPGKGSDLEKITRRAWKGFKEGDLTAFSLPCPCL